MVDDFPTAAIAGSKGVQTYELPWRNKSASSIALLYKRDPNCHR
jgi:hypothetical protein